MKRIILAGLFSICILLFVFLYAKMKDQTKLPSDQKVVFSPGKNPSKDDISSIVKSEFGSLIVMGNRGITNDFVIGDFNGDGIMDITVSVHPRNGLDKADHTILPFQFYKPNAFEECKFDMSDLARYQESFIRFPDEGMIVILHGSTLSGWEKIDKHNKHLLVDGWSLLPKTMKLFNGKLKSEQIGDAPLAVPPKLIGDAVWLLNHDTDEGDIIYWNGQSYSWYPTSKD